MHSKITITELYEVKDDFSWVGMTLYTGMFEPSKLIFRDT